MAGSPSREQVWRELRKRTLAEVRFDPGLRFLYSTDASIYQMDPLGVVLPRKTADVSKVVELAAEWRLPILPRGAGTSLAGQAVGCALHLDLSKHFNHIIEVNREERWARVQAGVVLDELNLALQPTGLCFGPDVATSSRATIGGMIGNNAAGAHSILYGKTIDHVRELKVVLSDGSTAVLREGRSEDEQTERITRTICTLAASLSEEIEHRYPKVLRRVSGYNLNEFVPGRPVNLSKMVVGSEGTLAVVTEARLNLVPRLAHKALCAVHYASLDGALESVQAILETDPASVELLDEMILNLTRGNLELSRRRAFVRGSPKALLMVEYYSDSVSELSHRLDALESKLRASGHGVEYVKLLDPAQQADVWSVRKAGVGLLLGVRPGATTGDRKPIAFVEDAAVPVEKMPAFIRQFEAVLKRHDTTAGIYAHASVGCLHIRPLIDLKQTPEVQKMSAITEEISDLVLEFGGSMSGEHGDGLARGHLNEKMFGPKIYQAFREVKAAFDPQNIMNPGKIVDCPPMTENLRYPGDTYSTIPFHPQYDYSAEGGFARAVEMCNGNGACRKKLEGTMCPSYMATHDEIHTTRARANLLRAAISGALPPEALVGRAMHDVMDLCLQCKGCKAECPSNVDMAKLKGEFLNSYHAVHGHSVRSEIFANIELINRLGCATAPLSNWLMNRPLMKWLNYRLLGIDDRRSMPPFAKPTFEECFRNRQCSVFSVRCSENSRPEQSTSYSPPITTNHQPLTTHQVVLFHDCFLNYNYPNVGISTVKLLEALGYEVILPEKRCCGRPMISKGFLDQARKNAQHNIEALNRYIDQGYDIVGCEPSCILTFRDEYPDLLPGEPAKRLAEHSFLIDEFLDKHIIDGKLPIAFNPREVLMHGHCHQKAVAGMAPLHRVLQAAGFTVEEIDSGCCGMGGSFGFEKEHYDISMAIGSLRLFKAVQAAAAHVEIIAPGTSCRQQIVDGTDRVARHPAEVLAESLIA